MYNVLSIFNKFLKFYRRTKTRMREYKFEEKGRRELYVLYAVCCSDRETKLCALLTNFIASNLWKNCRVKIFLYHFKELKIKFIIISAQVLYYILLKLYEFSKSLWSFLPLNNEGARVYIGGEWRKSVLGILLARLVLQSWCRLFKFGIS